MWYLNETNTEEIQADEINPGDIVLAHRLFGHGSKVTTIQKASRADGLYLKSSGSRMFLLRTDKVLRLLKNPDGTVMCAIDRAKDRFLSPSR